MEPIVIIYDVIYIASSIIKIALMVIAIKAIKIYIRRGGV